MFLDKQQTFSSPDAEVISENRLIAVSPNAPSPLLVSSVSEFSLRGWDSFLMTLTLQKERWEGHINKDKPGRSALSSSDEVFFLEVDATNKALTCGVKQLRVGAAVGRRKCEAGGSFPPMCMWRVPISCQIKSRFKTYSLQFDFAKMPTAIGREHNRFCFDRSWCSLSSKSLHSVPDW